MSSLLALSQIDKLVKKHFKGLKSDEILNFSVAITVMRVQRKWRSRIRAATLKRKQEERQARFAPPAWGAVVEGWKGIMSQAIKAREVRGRKMRKGIPVGGVWVAGRTAGSWAFPGLTEHGSNSFLGCPQ